MMLSEKFLIDIKETILKLSDDFLSPEEIQVEPMRDTYGALHGFRVVIENFFFEDIQVLYTLTPEATLLGGLVIKRNFQKQRIEVLKKILGETLFIEEGRQPLSDWMSFAGEEFLIIEKFSNEDNFLTSSFYSHFYASTRKLIELYRQFKESCKHYLRDISALERFYAKPLRRFVILSYPRTGSNLLIAILNTAQDVWCLHEIFHEREIYLYGDYRPHHFGVDMELRDRDPFLFLNLVFFHAYAFSPEITCVGFKIFHHHRKDFLETVLEREDLKKVLLRRENKLASYSSEQIALLSNVWFIRSGEEKVSPPQKLRFNRDHFTMYLHEIEEYENYLLKRFGKEMFVIEYNEIKTENKIRELLSFIGSEKEAEIGDYLLKQNPPLILERFENPDEVIRYLKEIGKEDWCKEIV